MHISTSNHSSGQVGHPEAEDMSIAIGIQQDASVDSDRSVEAISPEEFRLDAASDPPSPSPKSEATLDPDTVLFSIEDTTNIPPHYVAEGRCTGMLRPLSPAPYEGSSVEPQRLERVTASASAPSDTRSPLPAPDSVDTETARSPSRTLSRRSQSVPTLETTSVLETNDPYEEDDSNDETYVDSEQTDSFSAQSDEGDNTSINGEEEIERDGASNEEEESVDWYSDDWFPENERRIVPINSTGPARRVVQSASAFSCTCGKSLTTT